MQDDDRPDGVWLKFYARRSRRARTICFLGCSTAVTETVLAVTESPADQVDLSGGGRATLALPQTGVRIYYTSA